ncbi:large-conductance mechanosensitive channel protein MscL [Oscillatoria laete-virens NRMC-F 0139]|nr:large-conductance mechanosensitive channel protein MscL [Oscillatoria laete-virens]MDL5055233.1 large-conductance mechanosensitive channel protein MscL [Oscillatoria laete-virens NRMC-F 0139]
MSFFQEFKEFAVKGNAIDMAVGVIIGAAFNKIVNSIVQDIIMPPLGYVIGGVDFKNLQFVLKEAHTDAAGTLLPAVAIRYGSFINTVIEFLIIALSVFIVIKMMNKFIALRGNGPIASEKPAA